MKTLDPSIYPWIDAAKQAVKREKIKFCHYFSSIEETGDQAAYDAAYPLYIKALQDLYGVAIIPPSTADIDELKAIAAGNFHPKFNEVFPDVVFSEDD
ncbi:hypothetical protein [Gilliamella sp. Occ4-3]|uniref:hypothetical protein n=1 Tax=Gilliamella sp. Occ4-3 TaxID=3120254 RepID=UPI00080DB5EE|nr:hypothetical protein [Gilliamella apicola]OCG77091.1 hypothetical protein A9G44_06220 [Gilliamella apicola]